MPLREILLEVLEKNSEANLDAALTRQEQDTVRLFCQSDEVYPLNAPGW